MANNESFIDNVKIFLKAGNGGDGCLSFRREKFVPKGGPDGGNGGKGGDIYLQASRDLTTLLHLARNPHIKAKDGAGGSGALKNGKSATDTTIFVPQGTIVMENGRILADLNTHGAKLLAAKGSLGGRGNASFKTSFNTAPRISQKGQKGENKTLNLELKLLADVGFVGFPNAGKSTLLSAISAARPKIADYPFTTLHPSVGIVSHKNRNFVACDIPGLIEHAHKGKGLGDKFLKHLERTRLLLHIIDPLGFDGFTPLKSISVIEKELKKFNKKLFKTPKLLVVNKSDLEESKKAYEKLKKKYPEKVFLISAVTGDGINKLLDKTIEALAKIPIETKEIEKPQIPVYKMEPAFTITRKNDIIEIKGKKIEELLDKTNFDQPESIVRLRNIFKKIGLEKRIIKMGVKKSDTVVIAGRQFMWQEDGYEDIDDKSFPRRRRKQKFK